MLKGLHVNINLVITLREKCISKSVYVVTLLVALIEIRSWGAPILFFAFWCTQIFISLMTTALNAALLRQTKTIVVILKLSNTKCI